MEKDYKEKEMVLRAELKDDMMNLIQTHMAEAEELKLTFTQGQRLQDDKNKSLELRYKEVQKLYDERPSRMQDIEAIKMLKKDCLYKDKLLLKAEEDMKTYKLTLVYNEQSYNNMFGTNPNVGVMDPRAKENMMTPAT